NQRFDAGRRWRFAAYSERQRMKPGLSPAHLRRHVKFTIEKNVRLHSVAGSALASNRSDLDQDHGGVRLDTERTGQFSADQASRQMFRQKCQRYYLARLRTVPIVRRA